MSEGPSRRRLLRTAGATLAGGLAGCSFLGAQSEPGSDDGTVTPAPVPTADDRGPETPESIRILQILQWLTMPDERAGYDAMAEGFTKDLPNVQIRAPTARGLRFTEGRIIERIERGYPPAIWQRRPGEQLDALVERELLTDIESSVWAAGGLHSVYPEAVTALSGPGDSYVAVPWSGERLNNLFYNPAVLERAGVDPTALTGPRAFVEALSTIDAETEATPLAQSTTRPWLLGYLFENVLVGILGPETVRELSSGTAELESLEGISTTLELLASIREYVPEDANRIGWEQSVGRVLAGEAAMMVGGDWVVGGAETRNGIRAYSDAQFGRDWQHTVFPGTDGVVQFTADGFVAPVNNPTPELSIQWLRYCASTTGQRRYTSHSGTIPLRTDVQPTVLDPFARGQYRAYRDSATRLPSLTSGHVLTAGAHSAYLSALYDFGKSWDVRTTTGQLAELFER